ncbi:uncharacterized protein BKA78DRAFT_1144 [Phyllosticta capitalensis]|uniref:uncharacterized protein n=1 Tax=Phyllosticta capitalensis TaxID=121624 RepID=UPI0031320882
MAAHWSPFNLMFGLLTPLAPVSTCQNQIYIILFGAIALLHNPAALVKADGETVCDQNLIKHWDLYLRFALNNHSLLTGHLKIDATPALPFCYQGTRFASRGPHGRLPAHAIFRSQTWPENRSQSLLNHSSMWLQSFPKEKAAVPFSIGPTSCRPCAYAQTRRVHDPSPTESCTTSAGAMAAVAAAGIAAITRRSVQKAVTRQTEPFKA